MEDQLFNDEMLIGIRTGAKLIEVKKTNGLVKLNKEFLGIELGFLNKKELELLYILCLAYKERQVQSIKIHIKEIKELMSSGEKEIRKTDIENYVETLHKRLAKVNIRTNKSGISGTLNLFEYVITDTRDFETGIVTIIAKVTDTAMNFFNNLEGKRNKYLRFLIEDAIKLKGKYSALLLPHLIACSKVKEFEITTESLEEILGIKGKYSRKTDFNKRILKPTVEELEIIFKDLKVKALKKNELDPRKITHYKFTWSNNINYDDKKEETSFFVEIEETNSNDKKEYSKIFINDNVIDKTEEIEVAEVKVEAVDETDEELTAEEEIKKFISENIPTLNYKSIEKNIKSRLENGENSEEIIAFIKRNWHRAIDDDKYKSKIGILKKALEDNFELNLTKEEIQKEKNILNGKGILHKEVKYVKPDWSNSDIEEAKKKDTVKEEVKEIEIENIDYKKYLDIKKEKLIAFSNVTDTTKKNEIYLKSQEVAFRISFTRKYTVTLTKKEYDQEIKDLAEIFYKNNIKETTELYKNFFIIIKEEEVKEEVAVADVKKENAEVEKVIVETDEEKINQYLEFKEWEEEISKLPSMFELTEVHYKLFMLQKYMEEKKLSELDEEYNEVQERIWELEDEKDRLNKKLEEEKEKLWNTKFSKQAKERLKNIKTVEREKLDF
jgi:possible replication protein